MQTKFLFGEDFTTVKSPFRAVNVGVNEFKHDTENLAKYRYIMYHFTQNLLNKEPELKEKYDYDMFSFWGKNGSYFVPLNAFAMNGLARYFNKGKIARYLYYL